CIPRGERSGRALGHDHLSPPLHELRCERRKKVSLSVAEAVIEADVLPLDPAELAHAIAQRIEQETRGLPIGKAGHQHANVANGRVLSACRHWPRRRRAAEQGDELAPPHSITSSAVICMISGTVTPSAFAVLRLMTSSTLVGCITGSSAGFSPLR